MALSSGIYTIQNVNNRNWAMLLDGNDQGEVVAGSSSVVVCRAHTVGYLYLLFLCLGNLTSDRTLILPRSSNLRQIFVDRFESSRTHSPYLESRLDGRDAELGTLDLLSQAHISPLPFFSLFPLSTLSIDVRKPLIRRDESRTYDVSYRCEKFRL